MVSAVSEIEGLSACVAFEGSRCIASGTKLDVALKVKEFVDQDPNASVLVFDAETSDPVEIDFRGSAAEVIARIGQPLDTPTAPPAAAVGPGRPKLGVVAREVTLLPRHWDWLNTQPGGASVALRKLVEEARKAYAGKDRVRQSQEASYRFMYAMAGNLPGFEEASRALFSGRKEWFDALIEPWPVDIRDHVRKLSVAAVGG